nr:protein spire homolog 2 isoform X8 [Equus caballus]
MVVSPASSEAQMVQSLGFAIYRALDWGLDESEERELSPQLERLIDLMANNDCEDGGCGAADEGYGGPEEEEEAEGGPRAVRTFAQAMRLCAARLTDPRGAQAHYQAVCRALFVETLELRAFLARVREAKEMLQKLREDEPQAEKPLAELDNLGRTDWARLWVQLMRELRHGVKLKKVQEQEFNPLPTEFQLTPFEMLMQDIRARNYKLRKVMVDGDIPPRVKKDAHELILDFIRSRPPLKQVSERRLRPLPQKQRTLHEKILEEIKQERRLRPVGGECWGGRGFGSLPCILNACSGDIKSTSCINLSVMDAGSSAQRPRPRVLLKAPTLAEMEEMNTSEEEESPCGEVTLKRDRSFSEHDLVQLRSEVASGLQPATQPPGGLEPSRPRAGSVHAWRPSTQEQGSFPVSVQSQPDSSPLPRSDLGSREEDRPEEGRQEASEAPDAHHLWLISHRLLECPPTWRLASPRARGLRKSRAETSIFMRVQPPCGEPCPDCGGGDGCAPCAGEGRDGEVPAEQGALQQPEEGEDLLLLPYQVLTVLLATHLSFLQEFLEQEEVKLRTQGDHSSSSSQCRFPEGESCPQSRLQTGRRSPSSIQQSTDQHIDARKLLKAREESSEAGSGECQSMSQIWLTACFVNKVLLEHS